MDQLILTTILAPLVGVLLIGIVAGLGRDAVRLAALVTTLITLLLAGRIAYEMPSSGYEGVAANWLGGLAGSTFDIRLSVGLDGLGLWMFFLSAVLMVTSVLVSWEAIRERPALFYSMLLLLESGCLGVFAAKDIILFYVFFEFTLIPLFFLIGIWGSEQRRYAAIKFFLFTLAGSMLTFLGLLTIVLWNYQQSSGADARLTFNIAELTQGMQDHPLAFRWQLAVFLALFAGFAIKVPLFPVHTWLPLAHVQAPTAGSVILAGILLKIGVYGFLRFNVPMLPEASAACMPAILWLSAIGIIYGALVALAQSDMKRLIAYSSVSHLGYCMLGLFAFTPLGVQGSVLQMLNHGISTGALFAIVGMLYERYHTREIAAYGGIARKLPIMAFFMVLFTFSSIGLPGLNGFAGEFLILLGMFQRAWTTAGPDAFQLKAIMLLSMSGVVLGAWYMLYLVKRIFFGPVAEPVHEDDSHHAEHIAVRDLNLREIAALAPLAVLALWIGLRPGDWLSRMEPTLRDATTAVVTVLHEKTDLQPIPSAQVSKSETNY